MMAWQALVSAYIHSGLSSKPSVLIGVPEMSVGMLTNLLQDIKGYVFEFCRDQHGSRFIQQKLVDAAPEEIMALFEEVEQVVIPLMQDVFGNYVIQKCFEHGTEVRGLSLMQASNGHASNSSLFRLVQRCWWASTAVLLARLLLCEAS